MICHRKNNRAQKQLSITFRYAWGYCFDLKTCETIEFMLQEVNPGIHMLTKTLYNPQVFKDTDYKRDNLSGLRL